MAYAQKDYAEIEGNNPSLVVAFSNLLNKFGQDIDPAVLSRILTQDEPDVDFHSMPDYINGYKYVNLDQEATKWPDTADAIVRLVREDPNTGESFEHYCLVADPLAHSIIDSWDGRIKNAGIYSEITGYATYAKKAEEPVVVEAILDHPITPEPEEVSEDEIQYEVYRTPRNMHVIKPGGAHKMSFGNVKEWKHIQPTGPLNVWNKNLKIYGVAHVPVADTIKDFYMDSVSFGKYRITGRVHLTTGFDTEDLAEGHIYEPRPLEVPNPKPVRPIEPVVTPVEEEDTPPEDPNKYKSTYRAYAEPISYEVIERVKVDEHDGRRPSRMIEIGNFYDIAGEYEKDGQIYGRPAGAVQSGYWFGIPMSALMPEDDNYIVEEEPIPSMQRGKLSADEEVYEIGAKVASRYVWMMDWITNNLKIKRKGK